MNTRTVLLCGSAALALIVPSLVGFKAIDDTYNFKALPKVGDVSDYKETVNFTISGQDVLVETMLHQNIDVLAPDGGLQITQTESGTKVSVGGQPTAAPEATPQTLSFMPDGTLKEAKVQGADANWYRLFNLSVFVHPDAAIKVGGTWTKTFPANKTTGAVAFKATYTLAGLEKVGDWQTAKIKYSILETDVDSPASGEGTMWIGLSDSQLVKLENTFKNAQFPGGGGAMIDGKSSLERVK